LKGHTEAIVVADAGPVSDVQLDLLGFNIDSIICPGRIVIYSYNDTVIDIQLSPVINQSDSAGITIYYNGTPAQDASGWGGFYFTGGYAFNLGVGFAADPHNFGRAWYPCEDNFVSRSTYDFFITTSAGLKAFCNGTLQQSIGNPNGTFTWHWNMNHTIPSYLVSMAVGPFYTLERNSNGIPVQWATVAADTTDVLATFSNLDTVLGAYINTYGAYPFDKVGYCLVPFNSGAMEHATSIHIGQAFINGSQTYSTLWAHELSHMWWGDKVTCSTAEDMWLNEGFASWNEAYYTEIVSGETAYRDWIRANHRKVLQFAHTPAQDGSYLTMNAIPQAYTYGYHVYQKGADLVHTLRYYMGDSAFFAGSQAYMNNRAYQAASSQDLRDELTAGTGISMNRFFDDWIFTPGFPHFSIDSVIHIPGGLDHMFVYTRQRSKGNNNHLYEMPVELTFTDGITDTTVRVVIDSVTNMFHIPLYFAPVWTILDRYERVSDAISSNEKTITATGTVLMPETNITLNVQTLGTPATMIRVEHNFVPPDPFINSNPGIRLSDYHYWKVDGIFNPGFLSKAYFIYDGSTSGSTGYLDNTLITGTEDSLLLLYRQGAGYNWEPVPYFTRNPGANLVDKKGTILVDTLLKGEYTLGYYDYTVGIHENQVHESKFLQVAPNPSSGTFTLHIPELFKGSGTIMITDMGGREAFRIVNVRGGNDVTWDAAGRAAGIYHAGLWKGSVKLAGVNLVLR
jgi:aminopeptidase N